MRSIKLKHIIIIAVVALVAYNSVYFKKLDEVKAAQTAKQFNAAAYAQNFWDNKLVPHLDSAIDFNSLMHEFDLGLLGDSIAFAKYSHALGIGNLRYFLIKMQGKVTAIDADDITVLDGILRPSVKIATEYIFGNTARDATGLIDINDFSNTMDFNNVSAEINKIIRAKVLPQLKSVKVGNFISFVGAIELNKEHINLSQIEVIPLSVKILP